MDIYVTVFLASEESTVRSTSMSVNPTPVFMVVPAWIWRIGMSADVRMDTRAISVNWMWMNVKMILVSMVELVTTWMDCTNVLVPMDSG